MRKVIAAINTTLNAVCDHLAGVPDEELHQYYAQLLEQGGVIDMQNILRLSRTKTFRSGGVLLFYEL